MQEYQATEARLKMRDILTAVERGEPVVILRYNTPTAIVIPMGLYQVITRMAAELAPMTSCGQHGLAREDPRNCPDCSIRRVYLDYLAAGGTDTRLETVLGPDARAVPLADLQRNDRTKLPGQNGDQQ